MPTYKDEKTNTWYCKFYYTNWKGEKKQKLKRGFKLQREAKEYERKFLEQFAKNPDITFESLYLKYKEYITPRIRESSAAVRFRMLELHVLPFFKNRVVSDIGPADIAAWQNEMLQKNLSNTYIGTINTYMKAIFTYGVDYVGLAKNPCTKNIGCKKPKKVDFWTPEEYKLFISQLSQDKNAYNNLAYFTMFEILYYTGMRVGELLALTLNDIDFNSKVIHINKTYYRIPGKDLINPPKTADSARSVDIPDFLIDEIKDYVAHLYQPDPEARLFDRQPAHLRSILISRAEKAGIKPIRIHDLRHSHASTLINLGANPVLVAERLGHESADITLRIYSHLFPRQQSDIVAKIEKV